VVGFKITKASNNYSIKPIPSDDETLQDAKHASLLLDSIMQPAAAHQIAISIKKLSLHCGLQNKAPEEVKSLYMDYCIDLKEYPAKLIENACKEYRTMSEGNNFMPGSGKLISLMDAELRKMKRMRVRVNKILGTHVDKPLNQNKTVSLAEALSQFN